MTTTEKQLVVEMDLWIKFVENNKEPLKLGNAISTDSFNRKSIYGLYYIPSDIMKDTPYLLIEEEESFTNSFYPIRCGTIAQAKRELKKWDWKAKWLRGTL